MMATVGYTTTDALEARIDKAMAGNAALSTADQAEAAACLQRAYYAILAALLGRTVTKANADLWAQGSEFQLDIALYFYFVNSAQERGRPSKETDWLGKWDRREELETATLIKTDGTAIGTDDVVAAGWDLEDDE